MATVIYAECLGCGNDFRKKTKASKYCSEACRKRCQRNPRNEKGVSPVGLVTAVERDLKKAGRLDTVDGQAAMQLAHLMAGKYQTPAGLAQINRELRATLDRALAGVVIEKDPIDELRDRRNAKRSLAAS